MALRKTVTRRRSLRLALTGVLTSSVLFVGFASAAGADVNTPPDPAASVTATPTSTGLDFQWTAPSNAGTDAAGDPATISSYNVYLGTSSGAEDPTPVCSTSSTLCSVGSLSAGTTYYYEVTSVNSAGIETSLPTTEGSVAYVPSPVVTLSSTPSTATVNSSTTVTATLDLAAPGTVDFTVNHQSIGCDAQSVDTSGAPYVATCSYTPHSGATYEVEASFTPSDPATYNAASATPINVSVNAAIQNSLSITSTQGVFGQGLTLVVSGGSGTGSLSFQASDGTASGCVVQSGVLSVTSAGTCQVMATKGGDATYEPVSSPSTTVTFLRANQVTLTVATSTGSFDSPLNLVTHGGSGSGALSFSVTNGTASGCGATGTALSATSPGTCVVRATKAGDGNYVSETSAAVTFTFTRAAQASLVVNSPSGVFGSKASLVTTGGSGQGAVTYRILGGTALHCAVSGNLVTAASTGQCVVQVTKAQDADYLAATQTATVTFTKAPQSSVSVVSVSGVFGRTIALAATGGNGGGHLSFTLHGGTALGCRIVVKAGHDELTSKSAGTCVVVATKSADSNYLSASSAPLTVTIARAAQAAISFAGRTGPINGAIALQWHGGSGTGRVSFTVKDGTARACRVSGASLMAAGAGTCIVTLTKAATSSYRAASSLATTFTFIRELQTPLVVVPPATSTVGRAVTVVVTGGSGSGALRLVLAGGTSTSCKLTGATLNSSMAGTCVVVAIKKGDGRYRAKNSLPATYVFVPRVPVSITVSPTSGLHAGDRLHISASGFGPGERVLIIECASGATGLNQCDQAGQETVVADQNGHVAPVSFVVATGRIGTTNCGTTAANVSSCEVHVSGLGFAGGKAVGLTFVAAPTGRTFTVTPATGLKNGSVVTLTGTGFTPGDRVYYAECLVGSINEARCNLATFKSVKISAAGNFPPTRVTLATGHIGPGTCGTSVNDATACDISVAKSSLGDAAVANLTFVVP